jgi:hypothetical protein
MNQKRPTSILMEDTIPKVTRQHDNLHSPYGFDKEHSENLRSNAQFRGIDPIDHTAAVQAAGQEYADAHKQVPVYNYPSEVARDAAISLGEGRYDDTRSHLDNLQKMQFGGKHPEGNYAPGDMADLLHQPRDGTAEHQQGMVDYLRHKEANTPAILDAATVMVGGRIR